LFENYLIIFGVFFGMGYFSGSLFREIGVLKFIAILHIFPLIFVLITSINWWLSTIAFLTGSFYSFFKGKYYE
jgi:hypothetical protein